MAPRSGTNDFYTIPNATPNEEGLITCPLIPLADMVVYPNSIVPLFLEDKGAVAAAQAAVEQQHTVIGITQRDPSMHNPYPDELYTIGTEMALGHLLRMPDETTSMLAQGRQRVEIIDIRTEHGYMVATARPLPPPIAQTDQQKLMLAVVNMFRRASDLNSSIPEDLIIPALHSEDHGWLADMVASALMLTPEAQQEVLEILDPDVRIAHVARLLGKELSVLELEDEITSQVQQELGRNHRESYLREQLRVIQTELGEGDVFQQELQAIGDQIVEANLPHEVNERALKELAHLSMMSPLAPEFSVLRNYLEWLVAIPWDKQTTDNLDVTHAQQVLDAEHYGLPKVKERILEHIAVRQLAGSGTNGTILCFVGPPGTGKTSLGKSIAKALGREFIRISLGGVHDEAEIRGHRRTYIGALPGRIIQTMKRAGTVNPVFMLDEIDKLGADFRGDPADALLEVLDPEQNATYSDHYLEVPYDLSQVMFITTANDLDLLPAALLDRLEIIEFPGYIEEDKIEIAQQYLIPRQLEKHGLTDRNIQFELAALQTIIRDYTYEAGVRNLSREIANVCRKLARLVAGNKRAPRRITAGLVARYLGPPYYLGTLSLDEDSVGAVTGLVWTYGGGDITIFEVALLPGKGNLTMTGNLGDVMQESAQTALSYARSRADDLDVPADDFENYDIHVHVPEGAVPKDGPSAGITLAIAIISTLTECPVRHDFAMTGEITLRGKVLPVGGIREKIMAARQAKITNVIIPAHNEKDLIDVPKKLRRDLKLHLVDNMQQVMDLVLLAPPPDGRKRDANRCDDDESVDQDEE